MKHLFFGGIHPADKKELSAGSSLVTIMHPRQVSISMSQHIGVPCTPLVKVGDTVKKGDLLATVYVNKNIKLDEFDDIFVIK